MKIEVLYFKGCPNHRPVLELVQEVMHERGIEAEVEQVEVKSEADVKRLRFAGSPTVLVNDVDIEPAARGRKHYGFSCRTYAGVSGMPPREMVERALVQAVQRPRGLVRSLGVIPGVVLPVLPTVTCPVCLAAYAGVLSTLGLGFLLHENVLRPLIVVFLAVAVASIAWSMKQHRRLGPFVLACVGSLAIITGRVVWTFPMLMYVGIAGLVVASIWNLTVSGWFGRRGRSAEVNNVLENSSCCGDAGAGCGSESAARGS